MTLSLYKGPMVDQNNTEYEFRLGVDLYFLFTNLVVLELPLIRTVTEQKTHTDMVLKDASQVHTTEALGFKPRTFC